MSVAMTTQDEDLESELGPVGSALFHPLGVEGVYARTALYEDMIGRLDALVSRERDGRAEVLRFPPVMSRRELEKSGYLGSFPNLLGCVCALHGSELEIRAAADSHAAGGDWTQSLGPSDLVLSPAACYPVYRLAARRGPVPRGGLVFDVAAECFRKEPSRELSRLQSFRMREFVRIGSATDVMAFRNEWMDRATRLSEDLGLPGTLDVASDPFFGRIGQLKAVSQRQQSLKFELLVPYSLRTAPTACMSFNYHLDHFGLAWGLANGAGEVAHTGCVAFGMDRLVVALFVIHGLDMLRWPASVKRALAL